MINVALFFFLSTQVHALNPKRLTYVGFNPQSLETREGLRSILRGDEYSYGLAQSFMRPNFWRFSKKRWWALGHVMLPKSKRHPLGKLRRELKRFRRLPLGLSSFKRDNRKLVNTNCFSCHANVVAGQVHAGGPSTSFDAYTQIVQTDQIENLYGKARGVGKLMRNAVRGIYLGRKTDRLQAKFIEYYRGIVKPASRGAFVRGDNPGPFVVWYTIAKMKFDGGDVSWVDGLKESQLEKENLSWRKLPNVNPPPWWNLKYRKRSFWNADVSHYSPTTFSLNLLDQDPLTPLEIQKRMDRTRRHLDYARSIPSPKYPFAINRDLARRGHKVFHGVGKCFKCHGSYSMSGDLSKEDFPNKGQTNMGTDPEYARMLHQIAPLYRYAETMFRGFDEKGYFAAGEKTIARIPEEKGYAPPPLKGIWASAPYFHNGSVPTLAAVLDSSKRPKRWQSSLGALGYNQSEVGLVYKKIDKQEFHRIRARHNPKGTRKKDLAYRRIYDTTQFGRSSSGHRVGDDLTSAQRSALIEFLKSL